MTDLLISAPDGEAVPIHALRKQDLDAFLVRRSASARAQAALADFKAKAGQTCVIVRGDGRIERALFGLGEDERPDPMILRALPARLPPGDYRIASSPRGLGAGQAALAWALGGYAYDRYKRRSGPPRPRLVVADKTALNETRRIAHACALSRDMVNTPANDMGPLQIETIARELAESNGASIACVVGDDLHEANYPAVHAVGRAAAPARAPRMIELSWGAAGDPLIALVGKGVVFDTGGLNLKPTGGIRLMKKDMGGAAHVLALARMVMEAKLKVRLAVLIPAVENAVSGDAMRPGDIIPTRKGLTVEIGNTDAEGRLILADALARAVELEPELTLDFATLTGAARAALGPQIAPFYTADEVLARDLAEAGQRVSDPLWRMPLWKPYAEAVEGDLSDLRNDPEAWAQAGSVTAALFLQRFAPAKGWAHFDIFGWNPKGKPGFPVGADVMAARAVFDILKRRYS